MRQLNAIYSVITLFVGILATGGCSNAETEPLGDATAAVPGTVDSIFPIEEEIRRFKLAIEGEASELVGGAPSRDELVTGLIRALEQGDASAAAAAAITPAEFIDLYFPHTVYTRPPYEMDPAVIWFQMQNHGSRGLSRALDRFGSRAIDFHGYACPDEPRVEGPNRIWEGCRVRVGRGASEAELRLFGMIIERGGRFKFVSFGNDL